jgi:hypothetical protein
VYTTADRTKENSRRDQEVDPDDDVSIKFSVRNTNVYPTPVATIINPGGASVGYVGES